MLFDPKAEVFYMCPRTSGEDRSSRDKTAAQARLFVQCVCLYFVLACMLECKLRVFKVLPQVTVDATHSQMFLFVFNLCRCVCSRHGGGDGCRKFRRC